MSKPSQNHPYVLLRSNRIASIARSNLGELPISDAIRWVCVGVDRLQRQR